MRASAISDQSAEVEIVSERETSDGWSFEVRVGSEDLVTLGLSWADYDLWCPGGDRPPSSVAEAVLRFLLERVPAADLRESFDASIARRRDASADDVIPRMIRG